MRCSHFIPAFVFTGYRLVSFEGGSAIEWAFSTRYLEERFALTSLPVCVHMNMIAGEPPEHHQRGRRV